MRTQIVMWILVAAAVTIVASLVYPSDNTQYLKVQHGTETFLSSGSVQTTR